MLLSIVQAAFWSHAAKFQFTPVLLMLMMFTISIAQISI